MDIELRRLRHLIALADHGNFGRAAAAMYITQPALSRSIQALEAAVGARLVDRGRSGAELTEVGRLVLRHARSLEASASDLDRDIRLARNLEVGELRVGAGPWGGAALAAPVVGHLTAQHPRLRIRVVVAPWRELPARARAREVDLIVGSIGEIEQLDDFEDVRLSAHDTVTIARAGHPLLAAGDVTLGDLFAYPLAGPGLDTDASNILVALAKTVRPTPPMTADDLLTIECDSSDVLKQVLLGSDSLSFMPLFLVAAEIGSRQLAVVPGPDLGLRVQFGAAWLRGRSLGRAGTSFVELLHTHDQAVGAGRR
jgi:DNA-binding transcriptional LysR family regulator